MNIALKLTPAQETWIAAAVARGDFASPEEALASIIDTGIVRLETNARLCRCAMGLGLDGRNE